MYTLYQQVSMQNTESYAFDFNPDVVVVNLGTNEASYLRSQPTYSATFSSDYADFIGMIRSKNPNSYIVCVYGMMGINSTVDNGIKQAISELNDEKISYCSIQPNSDAVYAVGGHPSVSMNKEYADTVSRYLRELLRK